MSQRRLEYVWIACIAVLFNVFAMPLSSVLSGPDKKLLMWGGFCAAGDSRSLSQLLNQLDSQAPAEPAAEHSTHTCCCSNATVLALPAALSAAHGLIFRALAGRTALAVDHLARRRLWPSINPRASP